MPKIMAETLTADGYDVDVVEDRGQAVTRLRTTAPDVIVVDVNGSTLALLDWLRGADSALCAAATETPVIVLTSRSEGVHRVRLLERGGDDVIVKPFSYPELRARIAAVLRPTMPRQPRPVLTAGPVRIDLRDRRVTVDERAVKLSAVEYRLLCHLAAEPSRVFTRAELMDEVWGYAAPGRSRTLDSHTCRLRKKLACDTHRLVINVWGGRRQAHRLKASGHRALRRVGCGQPLRSWPRRLGGQAIGNPLGRASRTAMSRCQSLDRPAP